MEPNNMYEQEIDLKDLMFAVLYKWKPIIAVAILIGALLGGYKLITTYKAQNDAEVVEKANADYQKEVELFEKNQETGEREIENLTESIEKQQEYLEDSLLMNMSPYDVWEAKTVLFIKTDYVIMPGMDYQNVNYISTVLQAYRTSLTNLEFLKSVSKKVGMDERYLEELITITVDGNLLTLQARADKKTTVEKIMKELRNGIDDAQPRILDSIGEHTISEISESVGSLVDLALSDTQKSQNDRLVSLNNSLDQKKTELDEMEEPKPASSPKVSALKSGIKYGVLGGVLGAFMVVFFVCVFFLMSDKLYSAKDLRSRYRLKVLGTLPVIGRKKANPIDAWLRRLEGRVDPKTADTEYSLIAANVKNYADRIRSLLIVGTAADEAISAVAEKLGALIPELQIVRGGNMLQETEALAKLAASEGVILVEQCGRSTNSGVAAELEKTTDLQKPIVGCVVFE